jgi:hypothetical protein
MGKNKNDNKEILAWVKVKSTLSVKFPQVAEEVKPGPKMTAAIYLDTFVTIKSEGLNKDKADIDSSSMYEHSTNISTSSFTSVDQINKYINLLLLASVEDKKKVEYSSRDEHVYIDVTVNKDTPITFPVSILEMFKSKDSEVVELANKLFLETYIEYLEKVNGLMTSAYGNWK